MRENRPGGGATPLAGRLLTGRSSSVKDPAGLNRDRVETA